MRCVCGGPLKEMPSQDMASCLSCGLLVSRERLMTRALTEAINEGLYGYGADHRAERLRASILGEPAAPRMVGLLEFLEKEAADV